MTIREHYETREEWLAHRIAIGGSEAAAVVGLSPFMSNVELWELKTGRKKPKDLSGNSATQYGIRLESALRALFVAEHTEMNLKYFPYDILKQEEIPYIGCTLDGELVEKGTGKRGILEIKTSLVPSAVAKLKWVNQIPPNYYCQVLAQMIATGWEFAIVYAQLRRMDGDSEIKTYRFEREECLEDMKWLQGKLERFWFENIMRDVRPAAILPEL